MPRAVDLVTRVVYFLAGTFYMGLGLTVLLVGTMLMPQWLKEKIFDMGHNIPDTMHLIQEIGTLWILVGLAFVWFTKHYEHSYRFHWAVTFYLALVAWVHWFTAYGRFEHSSRALINAIPFAIFLVLGLLRKKYKVQYEVVQPWE